MQTPLAQPSDRIRFALIGAGGMGQGDAQNAASLGGEIVAACDVYDGRLARMKERYGNALFTTRDYREALARADIDAVIVATPDHWHAPITVAALKAGKHVYCQKPMVHRIPQGAAVVTAQKASGKFVQVGSQYASSLVFIKARERLQAGAIGELNLVEAWLDRNSALGAWQYSIPTDASPETIDWNGFLGPARKRPFEPVRLFRWRNYDDYGTGVAGDLFVHLLTGLHFVTGSIGPRRVFATGGLRYWKDGRDAADVMLAVMDYPATAAHPPFNFTLKVNLASGIEGERFGVRFIGGDGVMDVGYSTLKITRTRRDRKSMVPDTDERFDAGSYNAHLEHHRNFQNAIRAGKPFLEDAVFGFRAAAPALLCNLSLAGGVPLDWDPTGLE